MRIKRVLILKLANMDTFVWKSIKHGVFNVFRFICKLISSKCNIHDLQFKLTQAAGACRVSIYFFACCSTYKNKHIDESMVPYFGRHECKEFMKIKTSKFRYKLLVAGTPLGYAIQFYPFLGKTTIQL